MRHVTQMPVGGQVELDVIAVIPGFRGGNGLLHGRGFDPANAAELVAQYLAAG